MWTRNTCKYGDNFVYLKLDPEKGVVGCMQLPNIEIERLERGMAAKSINAEVDPKQKGLRFHWKIKDMEFNSWEVAHFRLLGDDRKLPYGTSMLEKARRIWKQLLLSEDAMLICVAPFSKIISAVTVPVVLFEMLIPITVAFVTLLVVYTTVGVVPTSAVI